jgi:hypothetical protein
VLHPALSPRSIPPCAAATHNIQVELHSVTKSVHLSTMARWNRQRRPIELFLASPIPVTAEHENSSRRNRECDVTRLLYPKQKSGAWKMLVLGGKKKRLGFFQLYQRAAVCVKRAPTRTRSCKKALPTAHPRLTGRINGLRLFRPSHSCNVQCGYGLLARVEVIMRAPWQRRPCVFMVCEFPHGVSISKQKVIADRM